jgi:hypothetical protein
VKLGLQTSLDYATEKITGATMCIASIAKGVNQFGTPAETRRNQNNMKILQKSHWSLSEWLRGGFQQRRAPRYRARSSIVAASQLHQPSM